jgi:hypothetical protein
MLFMQLVKAQKIDTSLTLSSPVLYKQLIQEHKKNKQTAWILCGSGIALMATGTYINLLHHLESDTRGSTSADALLFYSGAAATFASIPFFIAAKKKKTAASLALKGESSTMVNQKFLKLNYTALVLTIKLF